jgi:propane monooxygenase reductase subunit
MAPILSLLRSMADRGIDRKATFFYGARAQRDLCFVEELHAIAEKLPNFTYVPALSDAAVDEGEWVGEIGLITDVVKRLTGGNLSGAHAYVCGPPPMVEAAIPLLETLGVEDKRVYYDKFTTTGEPQ